MDRRKDEEQIVSKITKEDSLPPGRLIIKDEEGLEVPDKYKNELLIWDISTQDKKMVWVLAVESSFGTQQYMQLVKNCMHAGYKVVKKCQIEYNLLISLYDRKRFLDNQKASGDDSQAVALFETILTYALGERASDIHIEVRPTGGNIRMRIKSELVPYRAEKRMSFDESNNLCSVIYNVLASTKDVSFDPRDCQQAAVPRAIGDQEIKLRYQSVPAYPDGYDIILRVLPIGRSEEFTPLQELGYEEQQVEELISICSRSVGSLIIAGVTGSGKSTTLKNLLMYINANTGYRRKVYSIEDPPEYNIPRITQIPVVVGKDFDAQKMSPFEKPIKACMRGDPDIIMIGEVRDKITGDLTKKAVQSGHQVLTTVHATSALGILERFQDFGLSSRVLGSPDFLNGLLYQRLVKMVCPHCSHDFNALMKGQLDFRPNSAQVNMYRRISKIVNPLDFPLKLRNNSGCKYCKESGVVGLSVCAEVITLNLEIIEDISNDKTIELRKKWRGLSDNNPASSIMSGKSCMEHGFKKVLHGKTCPFDLEDVFQSLSLLYMSSYQTELAEKREALWESENNPLLAYKAKTQVMDNIVDI